MNDLLPEYEPIQDDSSWYLIEAIVVIGIIIIAGYVCYWLTIIQNEPYLINQ